MRASPCDCSLEKTKTATRHVKPMAIAITRRRGTVGSPWTEAGALEIAARAIHMLEATRVPPRVAICPSSTDFQPVADSGLVDQIARLRGIGFELLAELRHVHAQVLGVVGMGRSPDFFEQLAVCDDFARVLDEHAEQFVLGRREVDFPIVDEDLAFYEVDLELVERENGLGLFGTESGRVPQRDSDPREQLSDAERFGQV